MHREKPLSRALIAASLDQNVDRITVLINGTPQIV